MGSSTKVQGHFTLVSAASKEIIKQVCTAIEASPTFLKESSGYLKTAKMRKLFKDRYFKFYDQWGNIDGDFALETVKDIVAAFSKHSILVKSASMLITHEYGEMWKVELMDNVITLSVGETVYKPTKTLKLEVTEQVIKTTVVTFV